MQDAVNGFDVPMLGLKIGEWLEKLEEIVDEDGYLQPLGQRHVAAFVEDKPTLLVTFETYQGIQARGDTGQPLGFELVQALGWSHLCLLSDGDTWFRDPAVYAYFDRLVDDGFFEDFKEVVFYGAGPGCAYAAAAFSVAAPGARVVAIQPQATLDPRITGWETRHMHMRRTSFTDRYGYAPDMLDAAAEAFVIHDPYERLDAIHAGMFTRSNVTTLRMPFMGANIENDLLEMQLLFRILAKVASGTFNEAAFYAMARARRSYPPYLERLATALQFADRTVLEAVLCANVVCRMKSHKFLHRLEALEREALGDLEAG
ncbi:phosphoadenosine phosphosulfate reductase [Shimia sp. SDUM112013]|uniref:phosphoadenosine phosphosulfate reductase n=1 Tax=Shimia sp. SDUM112013 TaxID=3136160 RepID=UPI0032ECD0E8